MKFTSITNYLEEMFKSYGSRYLLNRFAAPTTK